MVEAISVKSLHVCDYYNYMITLGANSNFP